MEKILDFENKIVLEKDKKNVIEELKKEKCPLVLWGAGDVACAVKDYLEQNGIIPDVVWVDGEVEENTFFGIPILSIDMIQKKYAEVNVILGHSNFDLGDVVSKKYKQIKNVYYLVSIFYEQYENISYSFVKDNIEKYYVTYELLEDEMSRNSMVAYLNSRINNNIEYIKKTIEKEQDYYKNDIFEISDSERYVDVGAFDGDTIKQFLDRCDRQYDKIYAFEPEECNFKRLKQYVEEEKLENVFLYELGTWKYKDTLYFQSGEDKRSTLVDNSRGCEIAVDALDQVLINCDVSMIKVNFYYGVLETLEGAKEIIKKQKPKLAIVVGFDELALIRIPQFIKEINPNYKIYLRYNRCMPACLTLYAK